MESGSTHMAQDPIPSSSGLQHKSSVIKVWDGSKTTGKVVTVTDSYTDLVTKVRHKFQLDEAEDVRIVCGDGCEVDNNEGLSGMLQNGTQTFYFLKENESLTVQSDSAEQSNYSLLMENLKRKRCLKESEARQKKDRLTVRLSFGWMHYNCYQKRYVPVRSQKGGGTRSEEILRLATYDEMLNRMKDCFFPNEKTPLESSPSSTL